MELHKSSGQVEDKETQTNELQPDHKRAKLIRQTKDVTGILDMNYTHCYFRAVSLVCVPLSLFSKILSHVMEN